MSVQYHVYSNGGSGPIDYSAPVATTSGTSWSTPALAAPGAWRFGVRAFETGTGLEDANSDAVVEIDLAASGADLNRRPKAPVGLSLLAVSGGGVKATWSQPTYKPKPTGFHVYAGVGAPNYSAPAATVAYTGRLFYSAALSGFSNGATVAVAVRAFNADGEEQNTLSATATAVVAAPSPIASLKAYAVSRDAASPHEVPLIDPFA